jgi:hypothetical protein
MAPSAIFSAPLSRRLLEAHPVAAGALVLFALLAAAYLFSIDIRASRGASITGDEPFYLLTTQSILDDGDLDLRQQYERRSYTSFFDHPDPLWRQSVPTGEGVLLSPHNPGLSVLVLPGFALGGLVGVQVQLVLLAAATFACTYVLLVLVGARAAAAWVATAAVGLSATPFIYASEIYPEAPAALFLVLALITTVKGRGWPMALALAACLSAMMWLGLKYAPIVLLLAAFFAWRATWPGRAVLLGAAIPSAAAYAAFHLAVYGALTPYSVGAVHAGFSTGEVLESHFALDQAYRLYGIFIDRRFGIGRWAPVLFIAVLAAPLLLARARRPWGPLILGVIGLQLLMAVFVAITFMGWWFPGRTMMTVLPLLALPIALGISAYPRGLGIPFGVLALYSLAITAALAHAGHAREITIAVDPFDMGAFVFEGVGSLFPQYTAWGGHTRIATALWLAGGAVAGLPLYREPIVTLGRHRLAALRRSGAGEAGAAVE